MIALEILIIFAHFYLFGYHLAIMMKQYYVYILASARNGTLYTGISSDLIKRIWEHKSGLIKGFTEKYHIKTLVYYEIHTDVHAAIKREKSIKTWKRSWKLCLIEENNPDWNDLYQEILGS
jgi:putative endonuclease